jgi:tetratricopeptide (TPR) repeat protein
MSWILVVALLVAQADAAREAMRTGKFDEAARLYAALAKQYPQDFMIRYNVGLALYSAKKYAPALAEMKVFLKSQPASPQGNLIAGAALLKLNQACPAVGYFVKAVALKDLPEYLEQRAEAEAACGHPAEASRWFELLTVKQPRNTRAWYGLGLARVAEGKEAEAKVAFERLSALPPSPELRRLERDVARGLWTSGRYTEAKEALLRVKAAGVAEAALEYELGDCHEKLDGPEAALPFYREAVRLDGKFITARAALGRALVTLKQPEGAIAHLEIAAKANIDKSLWVALANAYRAVGRNEDARLALQKAR